MAKILITGGMGYIGSHIAKQLKASGHYVTIVDWAQRSHVTYYDKFLPMNFASDTVIDYIRATGVDAIIHCAGYIQVGESVANPVKYYENNVQRCIEFFSRLALLDKKPVVVFSSSAAVYGAPATTPIRESAPRVPTNPYGNTKMMVEDILLDYSRAYGLKVGCLRYFNACGASLDGELGQEAGASHIIARLLDAKLDNKVFTLNGTDYPTQDGTCVRDYIHVVDLATAHEMAVKYLMTKSNTFVANLGTGQGLSNKEIIDAVKAEVGHVDVINGPMRAGDPPKLVADPTYAQYLFDWYPQHSDVQTIVSSAWNWYKNRDKPVQV